MMKGPGSSGPLLALSGVSKHFGGLIALNRVSFALVPGEIVGSDPTAPARPR
jgi:ABC-type branched-subunit amino acid transport system ATPase component